MSPLPQPWETMTARGGSIATQRTRALNNFKKHNSVFKDPVPLANANGSNANAPSTGMLVPGAF